MKPSVGLVGAPLRLRTVAPPFPPKPPLLSARIALVATPAHVFSRWRLCSERLLHSGESALPSCRGRRRRFAAASSSSLFPLVTLTRTFTSIPIRPPPPSARHCARRRGPRRFHEDEGDQSVRLPSSSLSSSSSSSLFSSPFSSFLERGRDESGTAASEGGGPSAEETERLTRGAAEDRGEGDVGGDSGSPFFSLYDYEGHALDGLPTEVRVPRILFFGGDVVSLTALEALYERLECIARRAFALQENREEERPAGHTMASFYSEEGGGPAGVSCVHSYHHRLLHLTRTCHWHRMQRRRQRLLESRYAQPGELPANSREAQNVQSFVRDHLTVICPYLPNSITPAEAARRYSRQYPVARYAVEKGLTVIPVDHPRSLAKSQLLQDMLGDRGTAGTGLQHVRRLREWQQREEREKRRRRETRVGRLQTLLERYCGLTTAAATPPLSGPLYYFSASLFPTPTAAPPTRENGTTTTTTTKTTERRTPSVAASVSPPPPSAAPPSQDVSTPWTRHGRPLKDFDLAVVVSFRYFIPPRLLDALPPTINMHPSLLPFYRGASPIFSTLMRNEPFGGASVIQLRAQQRAMDSGNILWQCELPIPREMDIRTYMPLVTQLGAAGLCDTVFGERLERNPLWCQRWQPSAAAHTVRQESTGAAASDGVEKMCSHWAAEGGTDGAGGTTGGNAARPSHAEAACSHVSLEKPLIDTLPSALLPPLITPDVIGCALRAHRNYVLYLEHCALTGTVPSSPSASQRAVRCADAFPRSVRNSYCDWPDSFWFRWRTAAEQRYETFAHFSHDPFHAPLLPKDAAVLRFSVLTGTEAYGVWRAFVGGEYFQPTVNATLDKGCTPVRNQLARRTLRRLVREKLKQRGRQQQQQNGNGNGSPKNTSKTQGAVNTARASPSLHDSPSCLPKAHEPTKPTSNNRNSNAGGKEQQQQQQQPRKRKTQKAAPIDLDAAASIIDTSILQEVESHLRLSCTFTKALHPDLVPACVLAEMEAVELGPCSVAATAAAAGGGDGPEKPATAAVRFFRQPPPVFPWAQLERKVKEAEEARRHARRTKPLPKGGNQARKQGHQDPGEGARTSTTRQPVEGGEEPLSSGEAASPAGARSIVATLTTSASIAFAAALRYSFAAMLSGGFPGGTAKAPDGAEPCARAAAPSAKDVADDVDGDEEQQQEDEEAMRKECGLVLLRVPELRMALAGEEEDGGNDADVDEEAPLEYVPEVIPIAPPTACALPWLADVAEVVGSDFLESDRAEVAERAAVAAAARRAEKELQTIQRNKLAFAHAKSLRELKGGRGRTPALHIPPGTAYFPASDEHVGAIRCKDGWFFWQEAHLKHATRAQPVVLLRKGMAMKTGILYAGLFSEYCK